MRSVTVRLDDLRTMILNLGFVGENEHRTFNFDCKKMFGEYPSASVSLTVQPPAGDCYPATVERNGDLVSWTVTDSDLIEEGYGEIQLTFMVGDVVAKTCIGRTKVERSLGATGDIPTPIENWIEQAEEVISEAEAATAAAEGAAEHQPIIDDNGYWAVWDADAEEYVATEYKAQGTDGHDGVGIVSIEKTGTSGLVDTYTITFTSGNPVTYTVTNGRDADPADLIDDEAGAGDTDVVWSADKSHELLTEINSAKDDVSDLQKNKAPVIIDSAEGNPIVLTDGADGLPIEGMKIHFLPVQSGTGDPSPSNVRPISGWTGVTVWRTGRNLLDTGEATSGKGLTLTKNADGSIGVVGTPTGTWIDFGWNDVGIRAGAYMLSLRASIPCSFVLYYYIVGDSTRKYHALVNGKTSKAITFEGEVERVCFGLSSMNTSTAYNFNLAVQLELGSTVSPYTPYVGKSYPVTFPDGQTIYGGTLDAVNGVLTVDKQIYNLSDISWNKDTNRPGIFYGVITGRERNSDVIACSTYLVRNTSISTSQDKYISGYLSYGGQYIYLRDTDFAEMTATEMKDAVTGQLVYQLATPVEIPLSDIPVPVTLIGDNTIWSDANGTIELDYLADTGLFVGGYYKKPETGIPASDLESGVIPTVPAIATSAQIKTGTDSTHPIAPNRQNESVFYGLAKLAGADMASLSGETVGVYPDAQKVAIQKMLGIYESPWELIREDTVTNASEADVEINVDGDGNAFELTDVYLQVWTPQQETAASIGDYGRVQSHYGGNNIIVSQMGTWTQSANARAKYGQVLLTNENGAIRNETTPNATQYTLVNVTSRTNIISDDALLKIGTYSFAKITVKKVTGTVKYKLYGRRKWN